MARAPRPPPTIKATLTRFTLAAIVLVGLTISCFLTVDPDLRVLVGVLAFAAFLATLLFGMDAGKAINREPTVSSPLRTLGTVLIFPLAIFGIIFIGAGLVILFVSARTIEMEACSGQFPVLAAAQAVAALLMPLAGYGMLREGLRRNPQVVKVVQHGSRQVTVVSVPLWFRILMLTDGIAIGTSLLAYAVAGAATTCEAAAWIWSPMISSVIVVASAALAARIFALRRRRASRNTVSRD
jgi:hypothetical protein